MRWRSVRFGFVLVAMSALFAGSAVAANPGPVQFPLVPELRASVHDLCTGAAVSGIVASISDAAGASDAPSKTTRGGVVFETITSPSPTLVLHVTAPGYQAIGDPAATNPGVPVTRDPGPIQRVTKQPGPVGLPGEIRMYQGLNLAIALMPNAGCAGTPRMPKITALSGKVLDLATGAPISGLTGELLAEPNTGASNPGPIGFGDGSVKVANLACGVYNLTLNASGYQPLGPEVADVFQQGCGAPVGSGAIAWGTTVIVALVPQSFNQAPVIDFVFPSTVGPHVGTFDHMKLIAHDPDPNDTITFSWSQTGSSCSFNDSTLQEPNVTCTAPGLDEITTTVTDNHGASTSVTGGIYWVP